MSKSALITGINGFVGTYLAEYLLDQNYELIGLAKNSGSSKFKSSTLFGVQAGLKDIHTYEADITDSSRLEKILEDHSFDEIYHLAGQANIPASFINPDETWFVNFGGLQSLIRTCAKVSSKTKVLVVSSGAVYAQPQKSELPITIATPMRPDNPYSSSKAAGDMWVHDFLKMTDLHVQIARPFNHIGPGQDPSYSISSFAKQIAQVENDKVNSKLGYMQVGRLDVKRDFTDVRDIVKSYPLILEKGRSGSIHNIASGTSNPLYEILDELLMMTESKIEIMQDTSRIRVKDPSEINVDTKPFLEVTGWKPEIPLHKTLIDTLNFWREQLGT